MGYALTQVRLYGVVPCPGWTILAYGTGSTVTACWAGRKKSLGPNTEPHPPFFELRS